MPLSPAERQSRRRLKLKQQEKISFRLNLTHKLHSKLQRQAERRGMTLHAHLVDIIAKSKG